MTPSEPLNRTRLLGIAESHLQASQSAGEPLSEAVRKIMDSVSPFDRFSDHSPPDRGGGIAPIPLGDVAAYVDGTLSDANTEQLITSAASGDEGLMLDIILAIKSRSEAAATPPLPPALRSRLIGLGARSLPDSTATAEAPDASSLTTEEAEPIDPLDAVLPKTSPLTVIGRPEETGDVGVIATEPQQVPAKPANRTPWLAVAISVAAAVIFALGWRASSSSLFDAEVPVDRASEPMIVDARPTPESDSELLVEKTPSPPVELEPVEIVPESAPPMPEEKFAIEELPETNDPEPMIVETPVPKPAVSPMKPPAATSLVATWSQIDGLLLQSEQPVSQTTSMSSPLKDRSVRDGATLTLNGAPNDRRIRLQTLPLCRASADLTGGGRLVIAGDSRVEMTPDGTIDLRYGALALVGLGKDTGIRFGPDLAHSVAVGNSDGGSLVVERKLSGLEIDVTDGTVEIAGKPVEDAKVQVSVATLDTIRLGEAAERLPKWTRGRVDRIELGRNVLASLSQADDVGVAIQDELRSGKVQGKSAMLLRRWLVASRRDQLPRLFGVEDPLIRESALRYLLNTPPSDPRHPELWRRLRAMSPNPVRLALVRALLIDYWASRRPPANRRDQLLRLLQAPDPATRATGDFLLRSFYGKGPRFILNSDARMQQRMVGNWRSVIARADRL